MREYPDLTGQIFSRLTVLSFYPNNRQGRYWLCQCECGNTVIVISYGLRKGTARSCGCLRKELLSKSSTKHGMFSSPEYHAWRSMIDRTTTKKVKGINRYIERGIIVCDSWRHSFEQFYKDMGARPSPKHSIDRINNNGNYEPGNCRWATPKVQSNNMSSNVNIEVNGCTKTATQWSEITGVARDTIYYRIKDGWDPERAVTEKSRRIKPLKYIYIEINGEIKTPNQWSSVTGVKADTIRQRIRSGWEPCRAVK